MFGGDHNTPGTTRSPSSLSDGRRARGYRAFLRLSVVCVASLGLAAGAAGQLSPIPGDLNHDADVDGDDFTVFQQCATGADVALVDQSCQSADVDNDNDVDQVDFGLMQRCYSGSSAPADPGCVTGVPQWMPGDRAWARQALIKECNYIVDCSFTEFATNHAGVSSLADGYGTLNDIRIHQNGPDWVRTGEAAMGAVGLMAGARRLHADGVDISRYDQVLDRFFLTWLLERQQPVYATSGTHRNAMSAGLQYSTTGSLQSRSDPNAGVTGQTIVAMWKYGEYKRAIGQVSAADEWLQDAWTMARDAGEFIGRNINTTYNLVRSNSGSQDLWITDAVFGAASMRALARWSVAAGQTPPRDYEATTTAILGGIQGMADNGGWKGFFRYREAGQGYQPAYGDQVDQLSFLPYEAGVLNAGVTHAGGVSDFWTNGADGVYMTPYTTNPADWRYYGTFLHHYFDTSRDENSRLSPGASLQLARMEWRHAALSGDASALQRAWRRFVWTEDVAHSALWFGVTGAQEAGVYNGIVDWRKVDDQTQKAQDYERFIDTSAYFIEVALMLYYGTDTSYLAQ